MPLSPPQADTWLPPHESDVELTDVGTLASEMIPPVAIAGCASALMGCKQHSSSSELNSPVSDK